MSQSAHVVMETRAFWLLLLVMALGSSGWADEYVGLSPNQCVVPPKDRVDCGYPGVTQKQCNNRGCCFDSSIRNVPWCFKPLQETECTF
ncbi:Trefoil factor 3 [Heterocephalus glaber]|uniref:Trefoil factor 3 n=1 Tax=Heterocephalus glaber TaxID=10181 RepID=G5B2T8_HETGA|nr:trefoil factor 3 [Heterocephalus glaber]EHB03614.1 Trefoil factor 3 [Heterocephalus glaber]